MVKKILFGAVVSCCLTLAGVAFAGYDILAEVTITDGQAVGILTDVSDSADGQQYIYCGTLSWGDGSPTGLCAARDIDGEFRSCTTTEPDHISTIQSLSSSSYLMFRWDVDAPGACTLIYVINGSSMM